VNYDQHVKILYQELTGVGWGTAGGSLVNSWWLGSGYGRWNFQWQSMTVSVRQIMMLNMGCRHIGGNLTHWRWKGSCAPMFDAPNLQCRVYDIAVAATECNRHKHIVARGDCKMPCMVAPLCGECSLSISGQWAPLQLSRLPTYDAPRPAVKSACNPIPVLMQCVVG